MLQFQNHFATYKCSSNSAARHLLEVQTFDGEIKFDVIDVSDNIEKVLLSVEISATELQVSM